MIHKHIVDQQLAEIGALGRFLGRPELRELPKILFEGEIIRHLTIGRYEGGWATLCATDRRVLLIDKKPFYLTLEDIRYDMVSDVQYNHRLIDATIRLGTVHKTVSFLGYNHEKLRAFTNYVQEQVMHARLQPNQPTEPQQQRTDMAGQSLAPVVATSLEQGQQDRSYFPINPYKTPIVVRRRVSRFY